MSSRPTALEPLESRTLCAISWSNRGPKDGFDHIYGADAATARTLVDAALADWSAAIPTVNFTVKISATDIEKGSKHSDLLGRTGGHTIQLDKDAAGMGWYFDPNLNDNSDFPFVADGYRALKSESTIYSVASYRYGTRDFYTVALHELGHALDFVDKDNPHLKQIAPRRYQKDSHHSDHSDLMNPVLYGDTRSFISEYDILHTKLGAKLPIAHAPRTFYQLTATNLGNAVIVRTTGKSPNTSSMYRSFSPITEATDPNTLQKIGIDHDGIYVDIATSADPIYYGLYLDDAHRFILTTTNTPNPFAILEATYSSESGDPSRYVINFPQIPGAIKYGIVTTTTRNPQDAETWLPAADISDESTGRTIQFTSRDGSPYVFWLAFEYQNGAFGTWREFVPVPLTLTTSTLASS